MLGAVHRAGTQEMSQTSIKEVKHCFRISHKGRTLHANIFTLKEYAMLFFRYYLSLSVIRTKNRSIQKYFDKVIFKTCGKTNCRMTGRVGWHSRAVYNSLIIRELYFHYKNKARKTAFYVIKSEK